MLKEDMKIWIQDEQKQNLEKNDDGHKKGTLTNTSIENPRRTKAEKIQRTIY